MRAKLVGRIVALVNSVLGALLITGCAVAPEQPRTMTYGESLARGDSRQISLQADNEVETNPPPSGAPGSQQQQQTVITNPLPDRAALLRRAGQLEHDIAAQRVYARRCAETAQETRNLARQVKRGDELGYAIVRGLAEGQANASQEHLEELELEYQRILLMLQRSNE